MVPWSTSCRMVEPHVGPALRVEPRRRLVEEDDGRLADQAHGDVESAAHPAGEGHQAAVGGLVEIERVEQVCCGLPRIGDVAQLAHQHQVLAGGEQVVDRGELSGHADVLADVGGLFGHVEAGDGRRRRRRP